MNDLDSSARESDDVRPVHAINTENTIRAVLKSIGITDGAVVPKLANALDVSLSQMRKKIRFGTWRIHELLQIQEHLGVSLAGVLQGDTKDEPAVGFEPATMLINGKRIECETKLGPVVTSSKDSSRLACTRASGHLLISTIDALETEAPGQIRFAVDLMKVLGDPSPIRIAVLDDDFRAAESLSEYFVLNGYPSKAFERPQDLEAAGIENFDAFILDFILKGQTCYDLVRTIKAKDPSAVIRLLTGQVRDNATLEKQVAEIMLDQNVQVDMKPTSPSLLLAHIQTAIGSKR